jgi:phosphoglycerol transferase MdoB-like AlkP superfamily enzyme
MFGLSHRLLKIFNLIFIAVIFYFFARLEFLIWNWSLFKDKVLIDILYSFLIGLRFDLSATLTLGAPLILLFLFPWPEKWESKISTLIWVLFSLLQVPLFALNLIDVEFVNFVGRRFSYDSLFILREIPGKFLNFLSSYWMLFLVNIPLIILFVWLSRRAMSLKSAKNRNLPRPSKVIWNFFVGFLAIVLTIVGMRGGIQKKPISFVNANIFTAPALNNLILNSAFTFIKSYGAESLKNEKYFLDSMQMVAHLNGSLTGSAMERYRPERKQNVVIIILESFGEEFFGQSPEGKSRTPFLDSLKAKSLVFENSYANGRRSIEGVCSIFTGIPALMNEPFISSHFTSNYFVGLGTALSREGYHTSFFHGGRNGTMHFDSFMASAGVEKYFGASEYGNAEDDDGVWGIWDEPFLHWMGNKLDDFPKPFVTSIFTLSSHQPFKVPEKYKDRFKEGSIEILKTIEYTDHALEKFFQQIENKSWFNDTLFIITADHASQHFRPEYNNEIGNYRIPIFLFHPSFRFPATDTQKVSQHIDILPTIFDFLNVSQNEKIFLGQSLFVDGDRVVVNFIDGRYLLFARDYYLRWNLGSLSPQMFAIEDRNGEREIIESQLTLEQKERRAILFLKLKAAIQYFNEGMLDNKLYYPLQK